MLGRFVPRSPYPYWSKINGIGVMLEPDKEGNLLRGVREKGLGAISPQAFSAGNQNPFTERPVTFQRLVRGMGERIRHSNDSQLYAWADGVDFSCGGIAFLGPEITNGTACAGSAAVTQIIVSPAGDIYEISNSGDVFKNGSSTGLVTAGGAAVGILWRNDYLYAVEGSTGTKIWSYGPSAGPGWTDVSAGLPAGRKPSAITQVAGTLVILNVNDNKLYWTSADPVVGGSTWTASGVNPLLDNRTRLAASNGVVVAATARGISAIGALWSAGNTVNDITGFFASTASGTSPDPNFVEGNGSLWLPYQDEWLKLDVSSASSIAITTVGTERLSESVASIKGYVTCSAWHNNWFNYFWLYDGTNSYLMKYGAWLNPEEANSASWAFATPIHGSIAKISSLKVSSMAIVGSTMYIGTSGANNIRQIVLPTNSPSPLQSSSCRFQTSGTVNLPRHSGDFPANAKTGRAMTAFGPRLDSTRYVSFAYGVDEAAAGAPSTSTSLTGNVTASGTRYEFPDNTTYKNIDIKATLTGSSNTATPVVEGFILYESLDPANTMVRSLTVKAHNNLLLRDKKQDRLLHTAKYIRDQMKSAAASPNIPMVFPDGSSKRVTLFDYQERMRGHALGKEEWDIDLSLIEAAAFT